MQPVHGVETARDDQARVLQVTLQPTAIAFREIDQVGRTFLVVAGQILCEPHFPAGASHQRCFYAILTEDASAKGTVAGKSRERAMLDERFHPEDRVVPQIIRYAELPVVQARRENRAVEPAGELLHARED